MWRDMFNLVVLSSPYLAAMVGQRGRGAGWRRGLPRVGSNQVAAGARPRRRPRGDDASGLA